MLSYIVALFKLNRSQCASAVKIEISQCNTTKRSEESVYDCYFQWYCDRYICDLDVVAIIQFFFHGISVGHLLAENSNPFLLLDG